MKNFSFTTKNTCQTKIWNVNIFFVFFTPLKWELLVLSWAKENYSFFIFYLSSVLYAGMRLTVQSFIKREREGWWEVLTSQQVQNSKPCWELNVTKLILVSEACEPQANGTSFHFELQNSLHPIPLITVPQAGSTLLWLTSFSFLQSLSYTLSLPSSPFLKPWDY